MAKRTEACRDCPAIIDLINDQTGPLRDASSRIGSSALNGTVSLGGDITIERSDGTIFKHTGDLNNTRAVEVLNEIDKAIEDRSNEIKAGFSCGLGPVTLRGAGVDISVCRRMTQLLPPEERIDTNLGYDTPLPVFIQPTQSPPPKTS